VSSIRGRGATEADVWALARTSALIGIDLGDDAIFDLTNAKLFPPPADKKAEGGHASTRLPRSRWRSWQRSCSAATCLASPLWSIAPNAEHACIPRGCRLSGWAEPGAFPKGFVFGMATSAYQVMAARGGRGSSVRDVFAHTPQVKPLNNPLITETPFSHY
jgi:hypothetical protein